MVRHALLDLLIVMHLGGIAQVQPVEPVGAAGDQGRPSCGRVAFSGSGVITSPNYPNSYTNDMDCTYTVTAPSGAKIELVFHAFDLQTNFDYLTISSGSLLIGRFTSSTKPPRLTLGNVVTLHFTTDKSVVKNGFSVSFKTIVANCGGLIVGSGFVSSPGYPLAYPKNRACVWGLVANQGETLTVDFQSLNIEENKDWIELYYGNFFLARFTGSSIPLRVNLGPTGRIVFVTDASIQYSGFRIAVHSAALPCGGLITGETAVTSPNYPNNYPASASCYWTYKTVDVSLATVLTFKEFKLENKFDFVTIYDESTIRTVATGAVLPPEEVFRQTRFITIVFTSDATVQLTGFRLQFHPVFPIEFPVISVH